MNNQDNYSYEEVLELTKQGIEIWRRIVIDDIVFDYEVSNLGRIKSLKDNLRGSKRVGYGGLNKNNGYMSKELRYADESGSKKRKAYFVHRLVAITFIPNTFNKPCVDHIDTNKTNNRVDNLRWATQQENINNNVTKKNISKSQKGKTRRNLTDKEKYPCVTEKDVLTEKWRDIVGYEGIYEISNMGRVKRSGFRRSKFGKVKEGLVQPYINRDGYQIVGLIDRNGKRKTHLIHQLVAKHFIDNPSNHKIVDHINTNRIDNKYFNLRWTTQQENMNNDKTKENLSRPVIVLDRNGGIISDKLGVEETAKYIGIGKGTLTNLLKSNCPYRANIHKGSGDSDLLRSLNGIRCYYLDEYNEEKVVKEILEDEIDYSYCVGDLVCTYTNGTISEPMSGIKLAKELGISTPMIYRIRDSKKSYKAPSNHNGTISKEYLKHLQTLEGIRIMYYEDYLKEQNK